MTVIESITPITMKQGDHRKTFCLVTDTSGNARTGQSICSEAEFNAVEQESKAFADAIGQPGARIPDSHYKREVTQVLTITTSMGKEHHGVDRAYSKELAAALRAAADWIDDGNEGDDASFGNSFMHFHTA